jgi:apolipoprotein N-acyltransferase
MLARRRDTPRGRRVGSAFGLAAAAAASALAVWLYSRAEWPWIALGFVALVPWLAALDRTRSLQGALGAGLAMSAAYVLVLFHWLPSAIQGFSGAPWGWCLLLVVLSAPFIAPQFIALALVRRLAGRGRLLRVIPLGALAGAFAYTAADWAMPKLMSDTLGHPLFGSPLLRQGADVAGVLGLTFMLLLANECVLAIVRRVSAGRGNRRALAAPAVGFALLVLVPMAYGFVRQQQFAEPEAAAPAVTAGLVQAGFSHYNRMAAEQGTYVAVRTILDTHVALSRDALARRDLDLLVWPETVYPLTFGAPTTEEGAAFDRRIEELVRRTGVPLVFGSYEVEAGHSFNSAFFLEPSAGGDPRVTTYRKTRLFPLSEWVPALLDREPVRRRMPWLGTWTPGAGAKAITVNLADGRSLRVAPLICYDALVPGLAIDAVRDGAELILTLSNDSWFEYANAPRLLLILSAFRSIETRRPQLRLTNTGMSAVITPTGEIVDLMDVGERGVMIGSVIPRDGTTLVLRLGDWFGPASLAAVVVLLGVSLASRRRGARTDDADRA